MTNKLFRPFVALMAGSILLAACATPAAAPAAPAAPAAATEAPAAAAAPTEAPKAEAKSFQIPEVEAGKFNVAMVLIGPHDDGGWTQAHYEGLLYVEKNVPDSHVAYIENVPEGAEAEQVFRSLARKGFNLICRHLVRLHGSNGRPWPRNSPTRRSSTSAATSPTTRTSATCSAPWKT